MKKIFFSSLVLLPLLSHSQTDSSNKAISITAYTEIYYSTGLKKGTSQQHSSFLYSYNRLKEVNLNLGYIKASHAAANTRANIALATGTYMNANLAAEPGVLKNVFEANAGIKLSKKKNIWLDAGILPSHIGFESAVGKDNPTLTRSILAENSPYYEAGVKATYTAASNKLTVALLYLNGWQRITRAEGNTTPAWGHQLIYKPSDKLTINSSSFAGNDKPDSIRQMRYFHNLYFQWQPNSKLNITAGLDAGFQQRSKKSRQFNNWYAPILIVKLSPRPKYSIAARAEYYTDKNEVIVTTPQATGFQVFSSSVNFDYNISSHIVWRNEARIFNSKTPVFAANNKFTNGNTFITSSLAVAF